MLKRVLFFMILIVPGIMPGISLSSDSPSQLIGEGDSFFSQRAVGHIGNRATTAPILHAISSYVSAYDHENQSPELVIKIMRAFYFYIAYAEKDVEKRKEALWKSIQLGEEALKKYPDSVGINYWLGGCWGRWGEINGVFSSAKMGVAAKVRYYAKRTIELDPVYADGGGYRTLGILHSKAPRIPFILPWPSNKEAVKYLARAVETGPHNLTNHLYYAETLAKIGQIEKAINLLEKVVNAEVNPEKLIEELKDQQVAQSLLEDLKTLPDGEENED